MRDGFAAGERSPETHATKEPSWLIVHTGESVQGTTPAEPVRGGFGTQFD